MIINHNLSALNAWRALAINTANTQKALEKLSSGYRINRAGDDAAGLAISEKMRAQIAGLNQAQRNAQDGISLIQTAEGALTETHAILQRMRELVVQAGNLGTNQTEDLQAIQDEINRLNEEITGISERTQFNGKTLLNGNYTSTPLIFQIGANQNQQMSLTIGAMDASTLGVNTISVTTFASTSDINEALSAIDAAINTVSSQRSALGATQNRLEHTINNLGVASENLTAAESRIRDVDMAKEMMEFTKDNILNQAATAMLERMAA
ncbi:flagellin Hag [Thermoanaerobacter sp. RKWS2]|uniref:flagellin Hag n=1 Tax=Thermoanaerobacter sp. RKWS2 TaxID=2983842 RepID=UPI00224B77BE|nr:flagellin Hag [Thermoanaerobacter sp. RKWS2]UZQ83485.1 flagellin Hag [Thermoanaerobacter sp. RKWS2]